MSVVIRRRSSTGAALDQAVEGIVSVGRATDNTVELPGLRVALHHLRLTPLSPISLRAESVSSADFWLNGRPGQRTADLVAGDQIDVGLHSLRVGVLGAQGPVVLEVLEQDAAGTPDSERAATTLAQTGWRPRRWAYGLLAAVLLLGLAMPLAMRYVPHPAALASWLPTDHLWSSGRVSNAHLGFGHDCRVCHVRLFEPVRDEQCLDCHAEVAAHIDDPAALRQAELQSRSCASCHFEHGGADVVLNRHDGLCVDCHGSPEDFASLDVAHAIEDFDRSHPPFRVQVGVRDDSGIGRQRQPLNAQTRDASGLIFPHDLHLDARGIRGPDGAEVLTCASCHSADRASFGFVALRFENDCQRCHQLEVDFAGESLRLPHADGAAVRTLLNEARLRAEVDPDSRKPAAPATVRQRPGESADRGDEVTALDSIDEVFDRRVCAKCHDVRQQPGRPLDVDAPDLRQSWMVHARFTHEPHQAMRCEACHAAGNSQDSNDLMLPQIETCRACHAAVDSLDRFETRCADCHRFHQAMRSHAGKFTGVLADEMGGRP